MDENVENFLMANDVQLGKIYDEGIEQFKEGLLYVKFMVKEDKVDVIFINPEQINTLLTDNGWEEMKKRGENKRICLIQNGEKMCIVHI